MEAILKAENVERRFGRARALDGLSFSVPQGAVVGLLGRNGAGKSTLLRIVSGQLRQSGGEVLLADEKVFDNARALGRLCLIGDTPDFGGLGRAKDLAYVCAGLFPGWNAEYFSALLERFELPDKKLKSYSRGMQTSVMLAVGLASGAALTVFDEPSLGLDAVMRERFYDLLLDEKKRSPERTFLLSTHLIDEVARALDAAVLIDAGKLLCEGTVSELTGGYLSVSGDTDAVRELTSGLTLLKEEEAAGTLIRHVKLNSPADRERIEGDARVRTAPVGLQRLFVFLTEQEEAHRHAE